LFFRFFHRELVKVKSRRSTAGSCLKRQAVSHTEGATRKGVIEISSHLRGWELWRELLTRARLQITQKSRQGDSTNCPTTDSPTQFNFDQGTDHVITPQQFAEILWNHPVVRKTTYKRRPTCKKCSYNQLGHESPSPQISSLKTLSSGCPIQNRATMPYSIG
jgi:hypothetical protein